jgi:DNA-binding transcriptional ArsR family regulator
MTDKTSSHDEPDRRLRFACQCASAVPVAEDPWVAIPRQRKLNDGTKELILNLIHRQPRTITQLADLLGISAPAVHRHITELIAGELIREVDAPADGRRSGPKRYYAPNFPIVLATDRAVLQPILENLAIDIAAAFRGHREALAAAFAQTTLSESEGSFETLLHYLYATAVRTARAQLEAESGLPPWPEHADGSRWVWWAEEAPAREVM